MKRAENLISARICMESKYLNVRMVANYMNITVRYVKNFLTFNSDHKEEDDIEIAIDDYSTDECIENTSLTPLSIHVHPMRSSKQRQAS